MRIITFFEEKINHYFFILLLLGVYSNSLAQCPTVVNNFQTFCNTQSPRVSSLVASNNGGGVVWYATPTSATPLSNATGLVDGETYYADDNAGTCIERPSVLVKIYSAPIGSPFQGVCVDDPNEATVADLVAVGNEVKWYKQSVGGIPLTSSTLLVDNTLYYASQTNPNTGCETSRLSVFVNVGVVPVPSGAPEQEFCDDPSNPPTVGDIVVSGTGNIVWYATLSSSEPLLDSTPLVNGQSYYATTVDLPCESTTRLQVNVKLLKPNNAGTSGIKKICSTDLAAYPQFNLFNELTGNPDKTGVWTGLLPTTNGYLGTVDVSTLTLSGSPYVFTYSVSSAVCPLSESTVTLEILPPPTVSISANLTAICSGTSATVTFTGTPNATVTYTINNGTNQTIVLNNSGIATIIQNYINTVTYNLVSISSAGIPSCSQPQSGTITINVLPLPTVVISSDTTICPNSSATITFTGTPNATVTYSINGGNNQSIILNNLGIATITNTYSSTTVFSLISVATSGSPSCSQPQSGTATVTVTPLPTVLISGSATVCPGGSTVVTFTGTPNASVIYKINGGTNQTIILNATGTASISATYSNTTTYTLVSVSTSGTPSCTQPQTGSVVITVLPLPTATISTNTSICSGANATVTFSGTPNATVTYTINGGGNQTIVLNNLGNASISNIYTTTTIYNLVSVSSSGIPSCVQLLSGSMTILVVPLPIVTISNNVSICVNESATVTFTGTPNAIVTYTVDGGVNQTITLDALGIATITKNYTSTTTYTLVSVTLPGTPTCSQPQTGSTVITVIPLPTVTISGSTTICPNNSATITFTGTPNANVTYTIDNGPNQTITLNNLGTYFITNIYNQTTTYTLVDVTTSGTPNCKQPQTGSVVITVSPLPTVTISADTTVCNGSNATITFTGTPNAIVTYTINGGNNQTIQLDNSGIATITSTFSSTTIYSLVSVLSDGTPSCSQPQTGTVTITVVPPPTVTISSDTTICSGESATITFTGTPDATVIYTIDGGSNQTIILDNLGIATIVNTYSATTIFSLVSVTSPGTPNCTLPITGTATITVLPLPIVSISSDTTICSGSEATVTFTGTPNATVTYTVNGSGNQTITLDNSGIATITNTFSTNTIYTLVSVTSSGTPSCGQPQTATMTVFVEKLPIVTIASDSNICVGEEASVVFKGTPNAIVTYTIDGGNNQTIILDNLGEATITNTYSETTIFSLVSVATAGTPGCSQPQTGTVTINVIPLPTVTISADVNICSGDNATITFIGTPISIVTYNINGGNNQTIILNSEGVADITNSYTTDTTFNLVSISTMGVPSCSQPQTGSSKITVLPLPIVTISSDALICSGSSATVTFTGTPNTTVIYKIDNGINQTLLIDSSGIATISNTYTTTTTYTLVRVDLTNPPSCGQPQTGSMVIAVTQPPIAGNNSSLTLCSDSNPQDLFLLLGSSAQTGGTWNPKLASNTGIFNPAIDSPGTYIYTVIGTFPCPDDSAAVNVVVIPAVNAGTDGSANLCSNENPVDLFTYIGGTPQTGGTWSPVLASGTNIFNPSVDTAGKYTYTVTGTFPCSNDSSVVNVAITIGPDAGTSGEAVFCTNSAPQNLFNSLGGTPQIGGTWSPAMASGTGIFNPAVDPPGIYTYSFTGSNPCDSDSATVNVTVNPIPNAGTNGTAFFCTNYKPSDLFLNLGGTPQTGGTWSPALASGTGVFNPLIDLPGVYTYTVGGNYCETATATVTVTVTQSPNAGGANASLLINTCDTTTSVNLFTGLNGTQPLDGVWTDSAGTVINNIINPSTLGAGTYLYTYTVSGGTSPCLTDSATVTVVVSTSPNAGIFTGVQSICNAVGTFDLFTLLSGYQNGGNWTDSLGQTVTNPISIANLSANTYTYTYTVTNSCGTDAETVQLKVLQNPSITGAILNASTCCINFSNQVFITGANSLSNGIYTINYQLSGAVVATLSASVPFVSGSGTIVIPASQINNAGNITVTILEFVSNENQCATSGSTINPITFEVIKVDTPILESEGNEFCGSDNPTVADLTANIVGDIPVIWYNAPSGGTVYDETELLQNETTYYATYFPISNCESATRLAVTVDLTVCDDIIIPDGFSPNGDGINDEFVITNIDILYPNYSLEIYNRYGNLIYQGNSNTPNWNGTTTVDAVKIGNGGVPVGVYFYILTYNDGVTSPKQGRVYLSR